MIKRTFERNVEWHYVERPLTKSNPTQLFSLLKKAKLSARSRCFTEGQQEGGGRAQSDSSIFSCLMFSVGEEGGGVSCRVGSKHSPPLTAFTRESPDTCSSFSRSIMHFFSCSPMALESGGGTAFPTWTQRRQTVATVMVGAQGRRRGAANR